MRILSVLVFSLLVAGPALAGDGSDRWGKWEHSSKWQTQSQAPDAGADHPNTDHQADKWADYQLQLSAKLEKMDGKPGVRRGQQAMLSGELNSGVCDGLADATPGLQQLCVAFCELQDCRPDFSLENPYENCSASSTAVLDSYQTRRGAGDPDMPCVQQPDESAECPCWSRNELAELRSPLETDVAWTVKWDKDFIGKQALEKVNAEGVKLQLVCLDVAAEDADPWGYNPIFKDSQRVGMTSSGGYGHRVEKSIALGYVPPDLAGPGTRLEVEVLGRKLPAEVVAMPIYDPKNERMKA